MTSTLGKARFVSSKQHNGYSGDQLARCRVPAVFGRPPRAEDAGCCGQVRREGVYIALLVTGWKLRSSTVWVYRGWPRSSSSAAPSPVVVFYTT